MMAATERHLDVLRDLRRIHPHICSVAYAALESAGETHAHRAAETELVALPSATAQQSSR